MKPLNEIARLEIIADINCPRFANLTFKQKAAAWYGVGRPVVPGLAFFIIDRSVYCHPKNYEALRLEIKP